MMSEWRWVRDRAGVYCVESEGVQSGADELVVRGDLLGDFNCEARSARTW